MKVGMLPVWDKWGRRYPTTVLQLDECEVVQVKTEETNGYTALQVGVGEAKLKRVKISLKGHYDKAGVKPKRDLQEFRVTPDALLPVGTRIRAMHFVPGQVRICLPSLMLGMGNNTKLLIFYFYFLLFTFVF